jgi:hypothetical protein
LADRPSDARLPEYINPALSRPPGALLCNFLACSANTAFDSADWQIERMSKIFIGAMLIDKSRQKQTVPIGQRVEIILVKFGRPVGMPRHSQHLFFEALSATF